MREVRREPAFERMEVIEPQRLAGAAARKAIEALDVSDAEFETVLSSEPDARVKAGPNVAASDPAQHSFPNIGLLRQKVPFDSVSYSGDKTISPSFIAFTAISALAVFWLCGGHALLY